jgi:hypothetical protein
VTVRTLLVVSALLEVPTGLVLLIAPSLLVAVLLGAPLDNAAAGAVGRVAGAALLSLGVACWLARQDALSRAAKGLVGAMLLYNVAVMTVLVHARWGAGLFGPAFWPVLLAHGALAAWCIACLTRRGDHVPGAQQP